MCVANKSFIFLRATNYSHKVFDRFVHNASMVVNKRQRNTIPIPVATQAKHSIDPYTQACEESKQSINLIKLPSTTRPRSVIDITCQHDSHSTLIRINSYRFQSDFRSHLCHHTFPSLLFYCLEMQNTQMKFREENR